MILSGNSMKYYEHSEQGIDNWVNRNYINYLKKIISQITSIKYSMSLYGKHFFSRQSRLPTKATQKTGISYESEIWCLRKNEMSFMNVKS